MELNLGYLLKTRGMKPSELADKIDVSRGYVSDIISGKKAPSLEMVARIAQATGASAAELFDGQVVPHAAPKPAVDNAGFEEGATVYFIQEGERAEAPKTGVKGRHIQYMRVQRNHAAFGLLKGDELTIDLSAKSPHGQLAIVTQADLLTGNAFTKIKRITPDQILGDDPTEPVESWKSGGHNYAVLGSIISVYRLI